MGFWSYLLEQPISSDKETDTVYEFDGQTHNTHKIWFKALGNIHLSDFQDKKASDIIPILNNAILYLASKPEDFRELEPSNGWGNIESALRYLRELRNACEDYPNSYYHYSG